ncbi:hypothetical protein AABD40_08975 [Staphylococcus shinii]|uniref:hypothetical protein n=1 Tax=Staphylococcus shinii TaxID=2912228 RepID=UPI00298F2A3B|nr:hypothetical protein [Staphylococcus shinii]MDW8571133.1 hypothetical protein [Staphylococcus shinii]MDW8572961.1 hypothetical protein [Staphylococcus shinii]
MKKILSIIIIVLIIILAVFIYGFFLQKTADEKVKGVWTYDYDTKNNHSLYFKSDKDGMHVGRGGELVEVFPMKYANDKTFNFVLQENGDKNYIFKVIKKDKNHIIIKPIADKPKSLSKVLVGKSKSSDEDKEDKSIELKKTE